MIRVQVPALFALFFASACAPYHETVSTEQLLADTLDDDGDGVDGAADTCPRAREDRDGFEDADGCPEADNDGDGWVDVRDACPDVAGGDKSKDGCVPLFDADGDGLTDDRDSCVDKAESKNGYRDEDGCPDLKVGVDNNLIVGERKLEFAPNAADLTEQSKAILGELAWFIANNPDLKSVEIGVHTDDVGADKANLKLSIARANALRDALVAAGAPADRLSAVGYGETKPLVKATTPEARAQNQRVELLVKLDAGGERK